jgi:hypothetical protein
MKTITILNDFTDSPGLRHCDISERSGEEFYHMILNRAFAEAFSAGQKLTVILDYTSGYASSFLDEAFGNLVYDFTLKVVKEKVSIISEQEPHWKKMIEEKTYPQWEERRLSGERPIVTAEHPSWYRLINNQLIAEVWESPNAA